MKLLSLDWHVPNQVVAFSTSRRGGDSKPPFHGFNLALHVGDDTQQVKINRAQLETNLPNPCIWLNQVHSNQVVVVDETVQPSITLSADALYNKRKNQPLAIMTADCLPIFITSNCGREVAVIHAGWRGLLAGVIENTLHCFEAKRLNAFLGPAIGPNQFEVGEEVYQLFVDKNTDFADAFVEKDSVAKKYYANIYALARHILKSSALIEINGGEQCTYSEASDFYSYRRDGQTGRNAHIIYICE